MTAAAATRTPTIGTDRARAPPVGFGEAEALTERIHNQLCTQKVRKRNVRSASLGCGGSTVGGGRLATSSSSGLATSRGRAVSSATGTTSSGRAGTRGTASTGTADAASGTALDDVEDARLLGGTSRVTDLEDELGAGGLGGDPGVLGGTSLALQGGEGCTVEVGSVEEVEEVFGSSAGPLDEERLAGGHTGNAREDGR
jgi:hypothetical protein